MKINEFLPTRRLDEARFEINANALRIAKDALDKVATRMKTTFGFTEIFVDRNDTLEDHDFEHVIRSFDQRNFQDPEIEYHQLALLHNLKYEKKKKVNELYKSLSNYMRPVEFNFTQDDEYIFIIPYRKDGKLMMTNIAINLVKLPKKGKNNRVYLGSFALVITVNGNGFTDDEFYNVVTKRYK